MAVVLIARPYGLLGRRRGRSRSPAEIEESNPARERHREGAGAATSGRATCPAARRHALALHDRARHRRPDRNPVCDLAAFHHGPGRNALLRSCRLFRPGRLWRRRCWSNSLRHHGGALCSRRTLPRCGALLFGWFAVRLSGVYLAMLTLAFAQIVWSILFQWEGVTGGSNGILGIWPQAPFDGRSALLSAHPRAACCGRPAAAPFPVRAVRLCHARRPRLAAARRIDRHQCQTRALDRLRHRRHARGIAGGFFAFAKGTISPESVCGLPLHRRHRHGAARRHPDPDRADRRRLRVHLAAGHHHAPDRILARAARRRDPACWCSCFPRGIAGALGKRA